MLLKPSHATLYLSGDSEFHNAFCLLWRSQKGAFFSLRKTSLSFLRCIGCRVCLSVNLCDVTSGEAESVL